ncbi:MAG: hypothetical protein RL885_22965 [Planctomycetota bacterium]
MSWTRATRRVACLLIGISAFGCASQSTAVRDPLPFRVAIIPVETSLDRTLEATDSIEDKLEMQLEVDRVALSNALAEELEAGCFARTVVLGYPEDVDAETFASWPLHERAAWWESAARDAKADLILESSLVYSPYVEVHDNSLFWPNFVLFGLGGPFSFFLADQSYQVEARLRSRLIDLSPIYDGRASLQDGRSQLLLVQPELADVPLSLVDRAGGVGPYALGIVVPASFLSLDNEVVLAEVHAEVIRGLGTALAEQLASGADNVVTATRLFPFHCVPSDVVVSRAHDGVRVRGEVILRRGEGVESMDQFQVRAGEQMVSGEFGEGLADTELSAASESYYRYPFDATVPASPDATDIRITFWDSSRERNARSYTLAVK